MEKQACNVLISLAISFFTGLTDATRFTVVNNCPFTIWPATLGGNAQPSLTGFELARGAFQTISAPRNWSGRVWGRTRCSGGLKCATGDCGGKLACSGIGGAPPATLVEITLGATDFYDISLVDGFNLPVAIAPSNGGCFAPRCSRDVLPSCPPKQATRGPEGFVVGCLSACNVFHTEEYCCTGAHSTPETCLPTPRSMIFKNLCPQAYSYAYDDKSSTFTCTGSPDYNVTFCP